MAERQRKLQLKVGFEGKPEKELEVTAFVFDRAGELVASAPVRGGKADLVLPAGEHRPQIVLGPSALAEDGEPTLERLRRAGGHEPAFRLKPGVTTLELPLIPELDWHGWHQCRCRVRGRVVRPVRFGHGYSDMPVCNAIVHICEVDRWRLVIEKLPDLVLDRLRKDILVGPVQPPIPEPDPSPLAGRLGRDVLARVALNPQPLPPRALEAASHEAMPGHAPAMVTAAAEAVAPHAALALDATTRAVLSSESMESVRLTLIDQAALFVPYICIWKYLWPWFTCDEVAVVTTDENGRFDTSIWYPCFGDRPDIYVWVEYPVNGTPTTVYRPLMACNTYWNYQCGRELTVRVTDPRVPWCGDVPRPPGSQVVIVSVGEDLGFTEIEPSGLTNAGEPLGGSIEPVVLFGTALPAGVTHYRWSFRQLTRSSDPSFVPSSTWLGISEPVGRHFEVGGIPDWYPLPTIATAEGAVFQIPPTDPPGGPGSVWRPSLAVRANNASAFFLPGLRGAAGLAAGTHQLKLELFKVVGGIPVRVRLNEPGAQIDLKVVNEPVPLGMSPAPYAPAPVANHLVDGSDLVGFKWVLHIDDNLCESNIVDVVVGPNAAGPCGFIQYDPAATPPAEATIAFRAHHPNGFAAFSFQVSKGSTGQVGAASVPALPATDAVPVTAAAPNGFANDGSGNFTKDVLVATLLGGCVEAAFAETNYVYAIATDGWNRLSGYDASGPTKAFALEPTDS